MTQISREDDVMTLINVFTVAPENQQRLLDILIEATDAVMNKLPGFVSANLHRSLDGTHVINYAQWRTHADFEAMLADPTAREHMAGAAKLATFEPHLCEVAYPDEA